MIICAHCGVAVEEGAQHVPEPPRDALAPQFLVDDLDRSMRFYTDVLGFTFGEPWQGFYAIGTRGGMRLHLKCAPKTEADRTHRRANTHLDAYADVTDIESFYAACLAAGAEIVKPLEETPWGVRDFYLADPDGYIICFGAAA